MKQYRVLGFIDRSISINEEILANQISQLRQKHWEKDK